MNTRTTWALAALLMTTQAFAMENLVSKQSCNHDVGDCPSEGLGGSDANTSVISVYGEMDNAFWISNDGKAAGYGNWTTYAKKASQQVGQQSGGAEFKILPGTTPQRPDFSKYQMVPGAPKAFTDALQKAKQEKAAKLAFEEAMKKKKAAEQAAADKAAAEAAYKAAGVYSGPAINSAPAGGGVVLGARNRP